MKSKKRVVIVVAQYEPRAAYIENILADHLSHYCQVSVLTGDVASRAFAQVSGRDLPAARPRNFSVIPVRPFLAGRGRVLVRGLEAKLRELSPSGMILIGPSALLPAQAAVYARKCGIPFIVIAGENEQQGPSSSVGRALRRMYVDRVLAPLFGCIGRETRRFIGITPETVELARRSISEPELRALPYNEREVRFDEASGREWRRSQGWDDGSPIYLFLGKFEARKDLIALIREFDKFAKLAPAARLVLVGGGDDSYSTSVRIAARQSEHNNRIKVFPFLTQDEVVAVMNAADVSIWPNVSAGITQTMGAGVFALTRESPVSDFLTAGHATALGSTYPGERGALCRSLTRIDIEALRASREQRVQQAAVLYSAGRFAKDCLRMLFEEVIEPADDDIELRDPRHRPQNDGSQNRGD